MAEKGRKVNRLTLGSTASPALPHGPAQPASTAAAPQRATFLLRPGHLASLRMGSRHGSEQSLRQRHLHTTSVQQAEPTTAASAQPSGSLHVSAMQLGLEAEAGRQACKHEEQPHSRLESSPAWTAPSPVFARLMKALPCRAVSTVYSLRLSKALVMPESTGLMGT